MAYEIEKEEMKIMMQKMETERREIAPEKEENRIQVRDCLVGELLQQFVAENKALVDLDEKKLRGRLRKIISSEPGFNLHLSLWRFLKTYGNNKEKTGILDIKLFTVVVTIDKGKCFGELALINSQRRAARITCTQNTYFGVFEKSDYQKIVGIKLKKEMNSKIAFLKNFRLFNPLNAYKIQKLTYFMKVK